MADGKPSLYKTNWNKFEEAMNDVVRKEVCRVFLWLYKGGNKPVWQYLDEIQGGKNGLNKDEKQTLSKGDPPTNMDITLLYRLLQRTCGLAEASDPVWVDDNSTSLEHTLYLIKKERNELSHEGHKRKARKMSDADLDLKLHNLRRLSANILQEAARRCGRSSEVVKLTDNMEARLQEIQGVTADRFVLMAREERLRVAQPKMADKWYQQPVLRLHNQPVGLADLLQWKAADGAVPRFLLVSGEAGVGKSSLCRYLEECWLRPRSDDKDLLQHYRLLLRVRCGDICFSNPVQLLKEELLPEAASRCSSDTLSEILRTVPTLWLLDGLEEATQEASQLLSHFLRNLRLKSTVLLTSRPEFIRDFLQRQPTDITHLAVSLLGTDPLETIRRFTLASNCDQNTAQSLIEEFNNLDLGVQQELMNPLKLHLALQDWQATRTSTLRREFELSTLYQKITDVQTESLAEKLSEQSAMTKSEATRKVKKWFLFSCESTFCLVQSRRRFVGPAREEFLKKLEDKCDELRISSSKYMSTFLAHPDSVFSTDNNTYTFYHDSQVHFLAARHIASVMKGSQDVTTDTLALFNIAALQEHASVVPPLQHFFDALLFLVPLIDASTPDDNVRMVIKLLLNAMPLAFTMWMWFEVANKASYQPKVMREIARVIPECWMIFDTRIEAATRLLDLQEPKQILLLVFRNPEEVKGLERLIFTLVGLPVDISLCLINHFKNLSGNNTADAYLDVLCRKSHCVLAMLNAPLGSLGYCFLRHPKIINCCQVIKVKVQSIESLEKLCECVQSFHSLKKFCLVIAMKDLPYTSAKLPNVEKHVKLPYLTKETAANTAKFVARLSPSYEGLYVCDRLLNGIETFLHCLEKEGVTVDNLIGCIEEKEMETDVVTFGPFPLKYTLEEFRQRWSHYRSSVRKIQPTRDALRNTFLAARQ